MNNDFKSLECFQCLNCYIMKNKCVSVLIFKLQKVSDRNCILDHIFHYKTRIIKYTQLEKLLTYFKSITKKNMSGIGTTFFICFQIDNEEKNVYQINIDESEKIRFNESGSLLVKKKLSETIVRLRNQYIVGRKKN